MEQPVRTDSRSAAVDVLTFLFTDIEGSTRLAQDLGDAYAEAFDQHHAILGNAVDAAGGRVFRTSGDAVMAVFETADAAIAAAIAGQRALADATWPEEGSVRVRMGIHTGHARAVGDDYDGLDLHRVARIMSAGWGDQIVVSGTTEALLSDHDDVGLRELGEHRLQDLAAPERLYQVVAEGLRAEFPALRSLDATPNNLPTQLTALIGREREVAEVAELLTGTRLLTLTGPGGTGKTRLSLQVAAEVADRFPDGIFFAALAEISDPALVLSTVASSIGLSDSGSQRPIERLAAHLHGKQSLLVLDNFEQILEAAPDVAELLRAAPDTRIVVTSRGPLRVSGEQEYPVPPLALPNGSRNPEELLSYDAVELFVTRAAAVRPDFELTRENVDAVVDIVRRLDGLPLALELAASRVRLMPLPALAERLSTRLDLLAGGGRDLPARQRTLRDAIAWSHDLLEEPGRRVFERLSVFQGGASLEAVEEVCGAGLDADVLEMLEGLVDHSLVRSVERLGAPRFEMLEVIRGYALERLGQGGDGAATRRRHVDFVLALVEQAADGIGGPDQSAWLDRVQAEQANLRAAIGYASLDGATPLALRLVAAAWRYWQIRGHLSEGRHLAEQVLALPDVDDHLPEAAAAYEAAGSLAYWQNDPGQETLYKASLERFRQLEDQAGIAGALYNLSFFFLRGSDDDDPQLARRLLLEALENFRALEDDLGAARVEWGLSNLAQRDGDQQAAREHIERCIPVFERAGARTDLGWARHMLGSLEYLEGNLDAADAEFRKALDLFREDDDRSGVALQVANFAVTATGRRQWRRAIGLWSAAERLEQEAGSSLMETYDWWLPHVRPATQLPADEVERLRAEGAALSMDEAVAYALDDVLPSKSTNA